MHPPVRELPAYAALLAALQDLADATGSAWFVTNLPLNIAAPRLTEPVVVDPCQPCMLCGEIH